MTPDIQQDTQLELGPETEQEIGRDVQQKEEQTAGQKDGQTAEQYVGQDIRQTVEDLFQTVCELPLEDRGAYLDQACSGDKALRHEVEELLKFHESHETFLEKPALQDAARQMANRLATSENWKETQSDTLREGDWMLGPYRILDQLGKGGMGVVYLAEDTRDGKWVAIKVLPKDVDLDEDRLARFSREGRMLEELKHLKHPNIAGIYEQAEYDGKPCIALEYVPGDTLAERLRKGPLPIPEALQIGLQIADALESAHQQRIVHRDLKPANIKITPEGQVKILDFGLAKRFQGDVANEEAGDLRTRSMSLTESGMLLGTPAYMSPEQWNGQAIDQRADLWAFGCVLFEMLTGQPPFAGKSRAETMKAVFDANPNWRALPAGTPLIIQGLLLRCFQADVNQRLQSAKEARRSIAKAIAENKFAPLLYLKTWLEKFDRRIKAVLAAPTKKKVLYAAIVLILITILGLRFTKLGDLLIANKRIVVGEKDDFAIAFPQMVTRFTSDQVRAALMPNKQTSDDLLQGEQWKALINNQDNIKDIQEFIDAWKEKIKSDGKSSQSYAILAQAYLFKFRLVKDPADKDSALQSVREAIRLNSEIPAVIVAQGNVLLEVGEYTEAKALFEKAHQKLPDEPEILLGLALANDYNDDKEGQAEGLYKEVIAARQKQDGKPYWGDFNDFGWYYFERGRYEQAANCWREVIKLRPISPTGYINLGNALLYLGCFNEAAKTYGDSIANGGENVEARVNLGATYFYLGAYGNSINNLKLVTDKAGADEDTNLIVAWGNLGDSYSQIGQPDEALRAYNTALKLADKYLLQLRRDYQITALKAEILAKLSSLSQGSGQEAPIDLIEKTLDSKLNCLECVASAVIVYHLAQKDDVALRMAARAVDEGYSPFLLINNPQLVGLRNRAEFRQIEQITRNTRGKCGD
jgi:serine/threonine protein kinase/Flp pilus assembly protein TadD